MVIAQKRVNKARLMQGAQKNPMLARLAAEVVHDPLRFAEIAYPWGEGKLIGAKGPRDWQRQTLKTIGDMLKKNRFAPVRIARSSGHGCGKGMSLCDIIDTPNGRKVCGTLKVGDEVFGADGKPQTVVAVHDRGVLPMYRVTFDDGSSLLCDGDHLWNVRGRNSRRTGKMTWETVETRELMRRGVKRSNGAAANGVSGGAKQWEIPVQGVVEYEHKDVPIDPYVLGAWLGNGNGGGSDLTIAYSNPESKERILSSGHGIGYIYQKGDRQCEQINIKNILPALRGLSLLGCKSDTKFVPDIYKYNSPEVRLDVLRGLMDTDGECGKSGISVYASTSKRLVEDVIWLVRSFGGKAMLQATPKQGWYPDGEGGRVICKLCYRCTIRMPEDIPPFYVKKKLERIKPCERRYLTRWIESIEYEKDEACMCITVSNEDGLYLANDFIVTHNSALVAWLIQWALVTCPNARVLVTANTATQLATKTWPELSVWHNMSIFSSWFKLNSTNMHYALSEGYEKTWRADAIAWSITNTEAFAGLHNKGSRILIVIDEASGVDDKIWEVIEGALTDERTEIIWAVFGNPTRNTGRFRECFRRYKELWDGARVDSRYVDGTNKRQFSEWEETYGRDSDFFRVRVTGEFPDKATGQLIATETVREAQTRKYSLDVVTGQPKILGIDCALWGGDANVVYLRQGVFSKRVAKIFLGSEENTWLLAEQFSNIIHSEKPDMVFIDSGNFGVAIADMLTVKMGHKNVIKIGFGDRAADPRQYGNKRIEIWDRMRIWLESEGGMLPPAHSPDNEGLDIENDLISPEYHYDGQGRKMLERKQDMRRRGLHSPDDGDALALTFAHKVIAKHDTIDRRYKADVSWNPFSNFGFNQLVKLDEYNLMGGDE